MRGYLVVALSKDVVMVALEVAVVVGTLLAVVNHGDALLDGSLTGGNLVQIAITYLMPYGVSTYSSVKAVVGARDRGT